MNWYEDFNAAVTICNCDFIITYMNKKSIEEFNEYGGEKLIGTSLIDCHNPQSNKIMQQILNDGITHSYTRKKKTGIKKAIIQSPWYENGIIAGIVEISFIIQTEK